LYIVLTCCDSAMAELHAELGGGVVHSPSCKVRNVLLEVWL
jgi:hypothetical protein